MFNRAKKPNGHIDTLIGKGVRVNGDVVFEGGLHVDGYIGGGVHAAAGNGSALSISENGLIEGSVDAPQVVLNGRINGDIIASERLVLGAKARVKGDVYYGAIELTLGAEISGKLMPKKSNENGAEAEKSLSGREVLTLLQAKV